jgi:hypothetical protein
MASMILFADTYEELLKSIRKNVKRKTNIVVFKMSSSYLRYGRVNKGKERIRGAKHPLKSKSLALSVDSFVRTMKSYPEVLKAVGIDPWVCITEVRINA